MADSRLYDNEPSGYIKSEKLLNRLKICHIFKMDAARWR
jgi:hypothetical protein